MNHLKSNRERLKKHPKMEILRKTTQILTRPKAKLVKILGNLPPSNIRVDAHFDERANVGFRKTTYFALLFIIFHPFFKE